MDTINKTSNEKLIALLELLEYCIKQLRAAGYHNTANEVEKTLREINKDEE